MKKTFGNLSDNLLSRDQMKRIKGGMDETVDSGDGGASNKCCWSNDLTNCSTCSSGTVCVSGATLVAC